MMTCEEQFKKENDILRGLIAKQNTPCVYCGEVEIAKCPYGFPGCGRADDILAAEESLFQRLIADNTDLKNKIQFLVNDWPNTLEDEFRSFPDGIAWKQTN